MSVQAPAVRAAIRVRLLKKLYQKQILLKELEPKLLLALDDSDSPETQMQKALEYDFEEYMLNVHHIAKAVNAPEIKKLSIGEAVAIYDYTGKKFREINGALLGILEPKDGDPVKFEIMAAQAAKALAKLDAAPGITTRGEVRWKNGADVATYVEGNVFTIKQFWSTGDGVAFTGVWQITVHGKTGKKVGNLSDKPNENEVLYPPGTTFKVIEVNKNNPKNMLVVVKEV